MTNGPDTIYYCFVRYQQYRGTIRAGRVKVNSMERYRGQSMVELALVTPILLLLILITADSARVFSAHLSIGNAAREGASYAARTVGAECDEFENLELRTREASLQEAGSAGTIFGVAPTVDIQWPSSCGEPETCQDGFDGYECVRVTVNYEFEPLFSFPGLPSQIDLERSAQMRVLNV